MQLFCMMAVFFSRFEMELFETTAKDVEICDQFAPIIKSPVKVKIIGDRWASFEAAEESKMAVQSL